jgi:hypothetical protein
MEEGDGMKMKMKMMRKRMASEVGAPFRSRLEMLKLGH